MNLVEIVQAQFYFRSHIYCCVTCGIVMDLEKENEREEKLSP